MCNPNRIRETLALQNTANKVRLDSSSFTFTPPPVLIKFIVIESFQSKIEERRGRCKRSSNLNSREREEMRLENHLHDLQHYIP